MVDLPYESLIGISYGLLLGFVPALLFGLAAVGVGIGRDRSVPLLAGVGTVPIALALGYWIGIFDPSTGLSQTPRLAMGAVVAGVLGVVATNQGNRIAAELPRDRTFPIVRGRALSADAIDSVDAMGQVTIRPTGAIREFDGYPPLSPALRSALEDGAWRFPADLQLAELERRLEQRLESEYGLSMVEVSIDGRGRATIAAAPPAKGVATTLSDGTRAVTIAGLLPTGIEAGDTVAIDADGRTVEGDVLAVGNRPRSSEMDLDLDDDYRDAAAGFDGGHGQLTVAVETTAAGHLLESTTHRIAVLPSGDNHEFEAAALLEEAGHPVTAAEPSDGSVDSGTILGVHDGTDWRFDADDALDAAVQAFVAGTPSEVSD
ncbi:hypothetical protein [Halopiger goleimassiliensis]|uniref:hypothetical protein n=1 Tax=Halopiger goleimassiliensis TaxID=1293048 RepID=UPI000677B27B|nr:hypothetical protein [Halopiger goleimassiliensis]